VSIAQAGPRTEGVSRRARPTIWGLSPTDVHDRFWATRGVQVVRHGESYAIVKGAELFLLTDSDSLFLFALRPLVDLLSWVKPELLALRITDKREQPYREIVVSDSENRFLRFERFYSRSGSRPERAALTTDPGLARIWQNAPDTRSAWRILRSEIPRGSRTAADVDGRGFLRSEDSEVMECIRELLDIWSQPDSTVRRTARSGRKVWVDSEAAVEQGAKLLGPVWVGAGRKLTKSECVVGPAVLWDDPDARPKLEDVQWQEIEPTTPEILAAAPKAEVRSHPGKRIFDILFSLVVLALTLPLYPFIILAIMIEDGWPVFFAHRRETRGGHEFPCIKFRSMRRDAERIKAELAKENLADGPQFFMSADPRLTRIGRFLRKTQLDELPQFLNVLLGHMSVVGPRPSPRSENQYCPGWREARLSVRPGITGLWQVSRTRRRGLDFQEWIRFDLEYVEKITWTLDLWIILRTLLVLVKIGAR